MVRQMGSGFLIDPTGLILTNSHVVFGQQIITVTLDDGASLPAQIVGADPLLDIALIRVTPPASGRLPEAKLGDSEHLLVGEDVFAIETRSDWTRPSPAASSPRSTASSPAAPGPSGSR